MKIHTNIEAMLFALLRSALHEEPAVCDPFREATAEEWGACYRLAAAQGVMAVAWEGAMTLPEELRPPRTLRLTWGLAVEKYEQQYARYCRTAAELSALYAENGIVMVQMKGVGFSAHYPVPAHREGGDIDIFTYSADTAVMSHREANELANELMRRQGIEVDMHSPKHSNFYYKGVPVENHRSFLNVTEFVVAARMERVLREHLLPRPTSLLDGECNIMTPSPSFNALFIAFHALQHYGSGLALHHLYDWACLLQRYGWCLPAGADDAGMLRFIDAFTDLAHHLLGTEPVRGADSGLMERIYGEMLHPRYHLRELPAKGRWGILVEKTRRLLYTHRLKGEVIQGSLARRLWDSVVFHLRHPETIFSTGK